MSAPIQSSDTDKAIPNMELSQLLHRLDLQLITLRGTSQTTNSECLTLTEGILKIVTEDNMSVMYQNLVSKYSWKVDMALEETMKTNNATELVQLEAKQEDVVANAGDLELLDCMLNKGRFFSRIGDWKSAHVEFDKIIAKEKAGSGRKIDASFEKLKIFLFNSDINELKACIASSSKLVEAGGDWDRKNKLKVFEAFYSIIVRDISKAASLFHDGIATFSSTDLCDYSQFMFYAIFTNLMTLSRNDLKKKIIDNAHVISVIIEAPKLQVLVDTLYACNYKDFMIALSNLQSEIINDRFLGSHCVYLMREFRILAFKQFLEAYKSVMLSSMANSFGISIETLDKELSHFISSGRLNAKIDKVGDIVETIKSDKRNSQYQDIIKKGDAFLNQVQKLVRVIDQ